MEFKVPIQIRASSTPIFLKVVLIQQFPLTPPIIQIMTNVIHKDIDSNNFTYKGNAISRWTPQSNLVNLIQQIQIEFNGEPPIPVALI